MMGGGEPLAREDPALISSICSQRNELENMGKGKGKASVKKQQSVPVSNKICLNMIVKDEAHCIERCFDQVGHLINCAVIVDTGSTDDTVDKMKAWFTRKGLPYHIAQRAWKDFGHNRSQAIIEAEIFLLQQNEKLEEWYLMFMDADNMVFADGYNERNSVENGRRVPASYFPALPRLHSDQIIANMSSGETKYDYSWMISLRRKWKWYEPLHEYPDIDKSRDERPLIPPVQQRIGGGYVDSRREGARSKNPLKYYNDAQVFEKQVAERPDHPRSWHYLGQSYRDARLAEGTEEYKKECRDKSIAAYLKRGSLENGWVEEQYVSLVEASKLMIERKDKYTDILEPLFKAYEVLPRRLEAPYFILFLLRTNNKFKMAYTFAKPFLDKWDDLKTVPHGLFMDEPVYKWKFTDEASVSGFYAGAKAEAKVLVDRILKIHRQTPCLPPPEEERIKKNKKFFEQ